MTRKKTGRESAPGNPEYWKKVACRVCGQTLGSRVYENERYPVLHKNAETGETCKGSFQTAATGAAAPQGE